MERRLAAILITDIVGYSRLVALGEGSTIARQKAHREEVFDPKISGHGGRIVKTTGDGLLVEFPSVVDAVQCAVSIQRELAERDMDVPEDRRLQYRIGINLGDIVIDGDDILGDGVNIAARLEGLAKPGGICISGSVHDQLAGKLDVVFEDAGKQSVKNVPRPIRVWNWEIDHTQHQPTNTVGQMNFPDKPSIAVLPLEVMSGHADEQYFGDGIAEDVLTELSRLDWLLVIARNSSFVYRGNAVDVRQVSRELGVRYVLEGSVRRAGQHVRVVVQLIDAATAAHIWAEKYDRAFEDIFAVQDEITQAVSRAIAPAIIDTEQQRAIRRATDNLDAWEAYQRGLWHMSKFDASEISVARAFFQRAIEIDGSYALAHHGLAWSYTTEASVFGLISLQQGVERAEPHARRAVFLDNRNADIRARLALVLILKGDVNEAIREAQYAVRLNGNCAEAHGMEGFALAFSGARSEGREALRKCIELSPRGPTLPIRLSQVAGSYYFECDYENAALTAEEAVRISPRSPLPYKWLAASFGQLGRDAEAKAALQILAGIGSGLVEHQIRHRPPHWRSIDHKHFLEGLRKAGWQDNH